MRIFSLHCGQTPIVPARDSSTPRRFPQLEHLPRIMASPLGPRWRVAILRLETIPRGQSPPEKSLASIRCAIVVGALGSGPVAGAGLADSLGLLHRATVMKCQHGE